ncbi:uncharacterized protein LOC142503799 [Ascaphus truei]|uniref:uncharacterized protein LOC142503799 n=1 Tax=Ascaphus truei TaxID=8439 RepID=UPI003F5A1A12
MSSISENLQTEAIKGQDQLSTTNTAQALKSDHSLDKTRIHTETYSPERELKIMGQRPTSQSEEEKQSKETEGRLVEDICHTGADEQTMAEIPTSQPKEEKPSIKTQVRSEEEKPSIETQVRSEEEKPSIETQVRSEEEKPSIETQVRSEEEKPSIETQVRSEEEKPSIETQVRSEEEKPSIETQVRSEEEKPSIETQVRSEEEKPSIETQVRSEEEKPSIETQVRSEEEKPSIETQVRSEEEKPSIETQVRSEEEKPSIETQVRSEEEKPSIETQVRSEEEKPSIETQVRSEEEKPSIETQVRSEEEKPSVETQVRSEEEKPSIETQVRSEEEKPSIETQVRSEEEKPSIETQVRSEEEKPSVETQVRSEEEKPSVETQVRSEEEKPSIETEGRLVEDNCHTGADKQTMAEIPTRQPTQEKPPIETQVRSEEEKPSINTEDNADKKRFSIHLDKQFVTEVLTNVTSKADKQCAKWRQQAETCEHTETDGYIVRETQDNEIDLRDKSKPHGGWHFIRDNWVYVTVGLLVAVVSYLYVLLGATTSSDFSNSSVLQIFQHEFENLRTDFPGQNEVLWIRSQKMLQKHLNNSHPNEPITLILTAARDGELTLRCLSNRLARAYSSSLNATWLLIDGLSKATQDSNIVKLQIDETLSSGFQSTSRAAVLHRLEELPAGSLLILYKYCDHENAAFKNVALVLTVLLEEPTLEPGLPLRELEEKVRDFFWEKFARPSSLSSHSEMNADKLSGVWSRISHLVLPVLPIQTIEASSCP